MGLLLVLTKNILLSIKSCNCGNLSAREISSYRRVSGGVGVDYWLNMGNVLLRMKSMGVAKRWAVARARLDVEVDIPRLAAAMRKYANAPTFPLFSL